MSLSSWTGGRRRRPGRPAPAPAAGTVAASAQPVRPPETTPLVTSTGASAPGAAGAPNNGGAPGPAASRPATIGAPAQGTPVTAEGDAALEKWFTDMIAAERAAGRSATIYEDQLRLVRFRQGDRLTTELPQTTPRDIAARTGRAMAAARRTRAKGRSTASGRPMTPGSAVY